MPFVDLVDWWLNRGHQKPTQTKGTLTSENNQTTPSKTKPLWPLEIPRACGWLMWPRPCVLAPVVTKTLTSRDVVELRLLSHRHFLQEIFHAQIEPQLEEALNHCPAAVLEIMMNCAMTDSDIRHHGTAASVIADRDASDTCIVRKRFCSKSFSCIRCSIMDNTCTNCNYYTVVMNHEFN